MISLLIVEKHTAVREAFTVMLERHGNLSVVATASSIREAINLAWVHQPDIALVDAQLPNGDGCRLIEQLSQSVPHCRSIMVTSLEMPNQVRRAYESRAWAYISKNLPFAEIVHSIKLVHSGRNLIDPKLVSEVDQSPLTHRETDVLRMVARMGSTAEMAKEMHLSQGTINNYVSSILSKLRVSNRVQALMIAREKGWL